jgi:hypothetical protein
MPLHAGSNDRDHLLRELEKLHEEWGGQRQLMVRGQGMWLPGVHFGIEIGRQKIAEEIASSRMDLHALLRKWKRIRTRERIGPAAEALKGIDFGIRLVIRCVRRYLKRPAQRKPPRSIPPSRKPSMSANGNNADQKGSRGSRA